MFIHFLGWNKLMLTSSTGWKNNGQIWRNFFKNNQVKCDSLNSSNNTYICINNCKNIHLLTSTLITLCMIFPYMYVSTTLWLLCKITFEQVKTYEHLPCVSLTDFGPPISTFFYISHKTFNIKLNHKNESLLISNRGPFIPETSNQRPIFIDI